MQADAFHLVHAVLAKHLANDRRHRRIVARGDRPHPQVGVALFARAAQRRGHLFHRRSGARQLIVVQLRQRRLHKAVSVALDAGQRLAALFTQPMQVVPPVIRMIHRFYHAGGHQAAQRPAGAGLVDAQPGRQLGDAQRLLADFDHQMDLQRRKARAVALLVQHAEFSDQIARQCSEIPDVHN